jgi:capsular polysaccharide transport system permease protein
MAKVTSRNNWQVWKDVIFALFVREIRTGFSDKLGLSWAILNPIAFIFLLSFLRGRLDGGETHGMPTFVFMAHGMLMIQLFLTMFNSVVRVVKKASPLYAFRQVQPISPVVAASLFQVMVEVFIIFGVCLLMYLLSIELQMNNLLLFMSNFASLAAFTCLSSYRKY